jgi:HlyD family secretion protein
LASADAFPTSRFAAELSYINPGIDALRGTVEVKLRVADPPGYLRQDMTVSVDIETARRPNTIVIAADAVRDASGASPWVLIVRDNRAVRQAVRLGLRGDGNVEILEGVAAGDLLVPASLATVAPGDRVRAAAPDRSAAK